MTLDVKFSENTQSLPTDMSAKDSKVSANLGEKVVVHDGMNGATFYPSVSDEGVISWTNDRELENPTPVNIKGKDGYTPIKGVDYFTEAEKAEIVSAVVEMLPEIDDEPVNDTYYLDRDKLEKEGHSDSTYKLTEDIIEFITRFKAGERVFLKVLLADVGWCDTMIVKDTDTVNRYLIYRRYLTALDVGFKSQYYIGEIYYNAYGCWTASISENPLDDGLVTTKALQLYMDARFAEYGTPEEIAAVFEEYNAKVENLEKEFDNYYTKTDVDNEIAFAKEEMSSAIDDAFATFDTTITELRDDIGDISSALDELHAYAQNLVSGVSG